MQELTEEDIKAEEIVAKLIDPDKKGEDVNYKWDTDFQREILSCLLNDKAFLIQTKALIKPVYFTNDIHKKICNLLWKYFDEYHSLPSQIQMNQQLRDWVADKTDEIKVATLGEYNTVLNYYNPGKETRDFYRDKVKNFAKSQALKTAFHNCMDFIKKDPEAEETWSNINSTLRDAMLVEASFDIGLDYYNTVNERYNRAVESVEKKDFFVSGFQAIDDALKAGGLRRGEMGSWVGCSGTGKSLSLVAAAIANLKLGKKVLYISLEIAQDQVAERFDAQLADPDNVYGLKMDNLYKNKDVVVNALKEITNEMEDSRRMIIKQFPGGAMGMDEFRAYYSQICLHGFKPDLVIIDYIGEMKDYPGIPTHESRYRITRDLRGFAVEEQVGVLTAMQPNKSAKEVIRNGLLIDDENLGDSYAQIKPLDTMWTLNQLQEEKDAGIARIFVAKHRDGRSRFTFYVTFDYDTLKISQITQEKYESIRKKYLLTREKTVSEALQEELEQKKMYSVMNKKKGVAAGLSEEPLPEEPDVLAFLKEKQ